MKNKSLTTIFVIVFVDLLGFGIILPLLPYIAEKFNANAFQIGILSASYSFFQLIASPILGRLSDRYGRKKILIISQIGSAFGYLLLGLAHSLPLLFVSRIIDGITGGNISIAQAYIADVTTKENRAKGMGLIGAAFGLGFIFGPAIGGFLSRFGFAYPAFFACIVSLITVFSTYRYLDETVDVKNAKQSPKRSLTWKEFKEIVFNVHTGYLIVAFFLANTAFSSFQSTFALWSQQTFGYGPTENGYLFAFIGILAVVFQLQLLPFVVSKFHEKTILKYAIFILSLGFLVLPFVNSLYILLGSQFLIILGNSLANPSIQALASENVMKEDYGGTLGVLQSAGSMGRIVGPVTGGELFYVLGKESPFIASSVVMLFTFFFVAYSLRKKV